MTYTHLGTYELAYPLTHNYMCKHLSNLFVYQSASDWSSVIMYLVFPGGSDSKESACNVRDLGLIPVLGCPLEKEMGNPLQHSCLESSIDRGASQATVQRVSVSDAAERLTLQCI